MGLLPRPDPRTNPDPARNDLDLVVADVGWYTTAHLFQEVRAEGVRALLLDCLEVRHARKQWGSWRSSALMHSGHHLWRQRLALMPGWLNRWPHLGMRPIARAIRHWRASLDRRAPLALVVTYPHYLALANRLKPDKLIYFNVDDYRLYWPDQAEQIEALEAEAIRRADLSGFVSAFRAAEARALHPDRAERVRHIPHGAPDPWLAELDRPALPPDDLARLPRPWIGYVGTMEDRVDWPLVGQVARAFPMASVVLIGRADDSGDAPWQRERSEALALPNVRRLGQRSQSDVARYNRAFDVGLIPYRTDHPFNRASCPTKIMDYLASGLPVVSTDLPECRLHSTRMKVADSPEAFLGALRATLESGPDPVAREALRSWARGQSCSRLAAQLLEEIRAL